MSPLSYMLPLALFASAQCQKLVFNPGKGCGSSSEIKIKLYIEGGDKEDPKTECTLFYKVGYKIIDSVSTWMGDVWEGSSVVV